MIFLRDYFNSLTPQEQKAFAKRAGTSRTYIKYHLLGKRDGYRRMPSEDLIHRLIKAGGGELTYLSVLAEFFPKLKQEFFERVRMETTTRTSGKSKGDKEKDNASPLSPEADRDL